MIRPARIIVTSNYSLEEMYGEDKQGVLEPMQQRFKVIHMLGNVNTILCPPRLQGQTRLDASTFAQDPVDVCLPPSPIIIELIDSE